MGAGGHTGALRARRIDSSRDSRLLERRPRFREVPGLTQKLYGREAETGDVCGIYFFESAEAVAAFRESELARTIARPTKRPMCVARSTRCSTRSGPIGAPSEGSRNRRTRGEPG